MAKVLELTHLAHFLLNTMNNIYALTAFDTEKAQKAIIDLSKMLRHILYDYQQPYVNLKEEAEFLQNYVELMMIRIPDNVEITRECNIPDSCRILVAPMIFISLLENAFKHGISPGHRNFIHISLEADSKRVVFSIQNSNYPRGEAERNRHGIGLKQVEIIIASDNGSAATSCPQAESWTALIHDSFPPN